ncbi:MAG: AzlD domain-containing protein [Clostridia bacterium]|nr:AzlD domain-containing protein [Clostridia bacterium]MBQ7788585.1 AzlD domain-containing protein [Clostridia bacterium]
MNDFLIYLIILSGSTYLIRALPFALFKRTIENKFVRSFLSYIPYSVLAAMTLPAIFYSTGNVASSFAGLILGCIFAYKGKGLTLVALVSCLGAFATELIIMLLG